MCLLLTFPYPHLKADESELVAFASDLLRAVLSPVKLRVLLQAVKAPRPVAFLLWPISLRPLPNLFIASPFDACEIFLSRRL